MKAVNWRRLGLIFSASLILLKLFMAILLSYGQWRDCTQPIVESVTGVVGTILLLILLWGMSFGRGGGEKIVNKYAVVYFLTTAVWIVHNIYWIFYEIGGDELHRCWIGN